MSGSAPVKSTNLARERQRGRILLVSDDPALAGYRDAFERTGYNVVGVTGGLAALVAMRRTRPHMVIVDVNVAGMSAEELLRFLTESQHAVPVIWVGSVASTAELRHRAMKAGAFDYFQLPSELALLLSRTAQLIVLTQRMDGLRAEADRDYLTGLANRRRFRTALGKEVERWRRYRVPCALLLADIDFMKQINDKHGHSAGDTAIRHIASAMTELVRNNDTAARLGGEEFALLLAGTDDAKAVAAAERLRQVVSAEEIEQIGRITISIGVAACPVHATTERALYAASDAALYSAKRAGRDRAVMASIEGAPQA